MQASSETLASLLPSSHWKIFGGHSSKEELMGIIKCPEVHCMSARFSQNHVSIEPTGHFPHALFPLRFEEKGSRKGRFHRLLSKFLEQSHRFLPDEGIGNLPIVYLLDCIGEHMKLGEHLGKGSVKV